MARLKSRVPMDTDGGFTLTFDEAAAILGDCHLGDSIAVNGVCLTVTEFDSDSFKVGLAPETLERSNLGESARAARPVVRLVPPAADGRVTYCYDFYPLLQAPLRSETASTASVPSPATLASVATLSRSVVDSCLAIYLIGGPRRMSH